uniref:Uncharacterized protein n=1 Tax=Romanomermis culicivorax TaxID=13658 RepID=A0A915IBC3_ROMCU
MLIKVGGKYWRCNKQRDCHVDIMDNIQYCCDNTNIPFNEKLPAFKPNKRNLKSRWQTLKAKKYSD